MRPSRSHSLLTFACAHALLVVSAPLPPARADVLFVNAAAVGADDGSSWTDAFTRLESALAAAQPGDELWVAAGAYSPPTVAASFTLKNGVALYGGFAGDESDRNQRDWIANPTLLTGDVGRDDVFGYPVWYDGWNIHSDNCDTVVTASSVDASAVLDGFTVAQAHGAYTLGGGLRVLNASPTVANCTFWRNETGWGAGAGVYVSNGSPTLSNCSFIQNWCHICNGAGVYVTGSGSPLITDCTFTENHATAESGSSGQGSAISLWSAAPVTIQRCLFQYNSATRFYPNGTNEYGRGAGISAFSAVAHVRDCVFHHNTADLGAGIAAWDDADVTNCAFWSNSATFSSAGIMAFAFSPKSVAVTNCAVAGNTAGEAAAFEAFYSAAVVLRNSVVWANTATGADVDPRDRQFKGNHDIRFSCVMDLLTAPPGEDPYDPADYPGCLTVDPLLISIPAGNLRLAPDSPCLDAADNAAVPAGVLTDLDGRPRFYDDPRPDSGSGSPPLVDMGPYERQPDPCSPCDTNCDGSINGLDIAGFIAALAGSPDPCSPCNSDANADGSVNGQDISDFIACLAG